MNQERQQIIDIGLNLMHRQFEEDREEIIQRALQEKVSPLIVTGTNIRESKKAASYAETWKGKLYTTAGIHPHDAKGCNEKTISELKRIASLPQVVAIGECGLDYDRDFSPREVQGEWFEKQIQLAEELNMPLLLHERAAFKDFAAILKKYKNMASRSVVHCFTGTGVELKTYLDMGCYIGITGWICDERRGEHLRNLVKLIPMERLMIETDAPFLLPRNMKNKPSNRRNEPVFLRHILKDIANCLGKEVEEVCQVTYQNTVQFFRLDK